MELDPILTRKTIERLRASRVDVFGANGHRFERYPPLSESEVCSFERIHGIKLPAEYRYFMTRIGSGGARPYYGVFPLGQMDKRDGEGKWQEQDGLVGILSQPFPFFRSWNDLNAMPSEDLLRNNNAEYERQMDEFGRIYWNSSL